MNRVLLAMLAVLFELQLALLFHLSVDLVFLGSVVVGFALAADKPDENPWSLFSHK